MNKITCILVFLIVNYCTVFSQDEIKYKSGKSITCKVQSYQNGQFTVLTAEGKLINPQAANIESITFAGATTPAKNTNSTASSTVKPGTTGTAVKPSTTTSSAPKGEVKGNITYFMNNQVGDKPDIGATVLLRRIDSASINKSVIANYITARVNRVLVSTSNTDAKTKAECNDKLKALKADTPEGFKQLDAASSKELITLKGTNKTVTKVVADASGNFSAKVEQGVYEVIVISKLRKGITMTEFAGRINQKVIYVKANDSVIFNSNFPE